MTGIDPSGLKRIEELKEFCAALAAEFLVANTADRAILRGWHAEAKAELDYIRINGHLPKAKYPVITTTITEKET